MKSVLTITIIVIFSWFISSCSNCKDCYNPEKALEYYEIGMTFYDKGQKIDALIYFTKAIELYPDDPLSYYSRGSIRQELNDHYGAIDDFNKATKYDPEFFEAFDYCSMSYIHLELYQKAIDCIDNALDIKQEAHLYNNKGMVKFKLGDLQGALDEFSNGLNLDRNANYISKNVEKINVALNDYKYIDSLPLDSIKLKYYFE